MTNGYNNGEMPDPVPEESQPETGDQQEAIVDFDSLPIDEQMLVLRRDLDEAREELGQSREQVQRSQAELANFRRRTEEEQVSMRQDANRRLIMNLLPVVDELELAINHLNGADAGDSWVEGVKLIHRKAYGVLEAEGLTRIETVGVQFDPLQHEAVGVVDSEDQPSGYVVEALRNGYRLRDRVIQAAQVVVAR